MELNRYLRSDVVVIEEALEVIEHEIRAIRKRLSGIRAVAEDVQNLEEAGGPVPTSREEAQ